MKMKKLLSVMLVFILAFSTVTVVFAEETEKDVNEKIDTKLIDYLENDATDKEEIFVSVAFTYLLTGDLVDKSRRILDDVLGEGQYKEYYCYVGLPYADLYLTKGQIYKLARSGNVSYIHYRNITNYYKKTDTPYKVFYNHMFKYGYTPSPYKNPDKGIISLGKIGSSSLFYGTLDSSMNFEEETYHYDMPIGEYRFNFISILPCDIGLFVVKGNTVKPLFVSYEEDGIDMAKVVSLINKADNGNLINFDIYKGDKRIFGHNSARFIEDKCSLKSGATKTLKVIKGTAKQWKSSNTKVAKVNNKGTVSCLDKGTATITAVLTNGNKLICKVNVTTSPKLSKSKVVIKRGSSANVKISGKVPSIKKTFKNNSKVAKIYSCNCADAGSSKMTVVGLKKGKALFKIKVNGVKTLRLLVVVK